MNIVVFIESQFSTAVNTLSDWEWALLPGTIVLVKYRVSWLKFDNQCHICYEGPILIMRFLPFHCALNCSLGCFLIPK